MFDAGSAQKYQCPLCREEYCLMCHSKTCGCIRREMNANIGFENWMSENNIKKCPSCGIPVENETRSVTVECVMCHLSFCFTCGLSKKVCSCQ